MRSNKGRLPIIAVAVVVGVLTATAALASTSVTITSPAAGSVISKRRTPNLSVAGTVTFDPATAGSTKFYLRRDGCGSSNDNPHLSVISGTDAGDGCGSTLDMTGVTSQDTSLYTTSFPAADGVPLVLDTSQKITGVLDFQPFVGIGDVGQMTVDFSIDGLANGGPVSVGSDAETVTLDPTASETLVDFTITPDPALGSATMGAIALNVRFEGPYAGGAFISLSGKSYLTVPTVSASTGKAVQVTLDDPSFAQPLAATLNQSATGWTLTVPTPAVGTHTIYARSVQGSAVSSAATRTFTVKK